MDDDKNKLPSPFVMVTAALASLSSGMLAGVYYVSRKEKIKLNLKQHGHPAMVAGKALLYGTILCWGSFGFAWAAFSGLTGISSVQEFSRNAKSTLDSLELIRHEKRRRAAENERFAGMSEQQISDYWVKVVLDSDGDENFENTIDKPVQLPKSEICCSVMPANLSFSAVNEFDENEDNGNIQPCERLLDCLDCLTSEKDAQLQHFNHSVRVEMHYN